ncbi:hypothetical protein B0H14DRAFT_2680884 [Mycena olivaceomarginata]|nr:hypothetical protein B0H14DRAFT_2680884 [Mycena olivaceomarginata]
MAESLSDVVIQQQLEISRYLVLIPFTILVYDYALTFRLEVERFWGTRLTWGTILVYVNRYLTLFGTVPVLAEVLLTTTDPGKAAICNASQEYHKYFAYASLQQATPYELILHRLGSLVLVADDLQVILIMRTYALYERNKYVLAFMLFVLFFAFVFALSMLLTGNRRDTLDPTLKSILCPSPTPHDSFTVYKALRHEIRNGGLLSVLLRDGAPLIIIVANVANIVTYTSDCDVVFLSLSSVMITRLMLNLRDPKLLRRAQRNPTRNLTTTESYNYDSACDRLE